MARLLITATYGHDNATRASMPFYVMGSAREPVEPTVAALSRRLGRAIAERGCCLLTGACPGLPHEAVLAARELDGPSSGSRPPRRCESTSRPSVRRIASTRC